jgi:hypothetical protein
MNKATSIALIAIISLGQLAETTAMASPGRGFGGVGPGVAGPVGVGGVVARRTIIASTILVRTLPTGCVPVSIEGTALYQCGTTYYQAQGSQYVFVTVK